MRYSLLAALVLAAPMGIPAWAAAAPAAQATRFTVADTPIGALRADSGASAVVAQIFPGLFASKELTDGLADRMTLKAIQKFHPDIFTDARLAAVDAGLAQLARP